MYSTYLYIVLVLPAFIISLIAQARVKSVYSKYSKIASRSGYTAVTAVQALLSSYGIYNVGICRIAGNLTDNYNPKKNMISLSEGVYYSNSIASIGIACHEAGHASQHAESYLPIKLRNMLIPVCNIGSYVGLPLAIVGYFLGFGSLVYVGLGLYSVICVFQLATLPVEFNASRRAIKVIEERGLLQGDELEGAKKVLRAAAMTYVASLWVSIANLLRLVLVFTGGKRRR